MSLQMLGTPCSCRTQMDFLMARCAEQILSTERSCPFLVIRAEISFPYKKTTLFLKDAHVRNFCCKSRHRQGHVGGITTSMEWELPAGSCVTISWLGLSCVQGICATPACTHSGCQVDHPGVQ